MLYVRKTNKFRKHCLRPIGIFKKSIIKEMRGGSSVPQREENKLGREMKAKMDERIALETPDFKLGDHGLM